ncbi:hypothetical protein [Erwinia sp. HR93]|uniref:hypothetical protein n=1 Tax=Erwinia sp. HR93 TaxID=3094840 RepID=UPI002ADEA77E|nr:hypothetical protein [Erwinia sp. HR93]MEA1063206.1 hypothetical protein [Erwinia sp. HR93]
MSNTLENAPSQRPHHESGKRRGNNPPKKINEEFNVHNILLASRKIQEIILLVTVTITLIKESKLSCAVGNLPSVLFISIISIGYN